MFMIYPIFVFPCINLLSVVFRVSADANQTNEAI